MTATMIITLIPTSKNSTKLPENHIHKNMQMEYSKVRELLSWEDASRDILMNPLTKMPARMYEGSR